MFCFSDCFSDFDDHLLNESCLTSFMQEDHDTKLPKDMIRLIFSNLNSNNLDHFKALGFASQVSKEWKEVAEVFFDEKRKRLFEQVVFSPIDWNHHFKMNLFSEAEQIQVFKSLSLLVDLIPCPIDNTKVLTETHVIVWIPAGLTITCFGEFLKNKFPKNQRGYQEICQKIIEQLGDRSIEQSGFVAMTKYPIPNSKYTTSKNRYELVDRIAKVNGIRYNVPTLLEAIICIAGAFLKTQNKIFCDSFVLCQDTIDWDFKQTVVKHALGGLMIDLIGSCFSSSIYPEVVAVGVWRL